MLLVPMCDLIYAPLGVLLPSGDSGRVVSRVGRVRKAPNVGVELQRGVTLGLRVVTLGCPYPSSHPVSRTTTLTHGLGMVGEDQNMPEINL